MALQLYWQSPPPWLAIVTRPGSVVVTRAPTINKIITATNFNAPICPSFSHLCHLFTSTKWKSTPNKKSDESGLLFDNKEKEELVKGPTMTIKSSRCVSYKGVGWPHLAPISPLLWISRQLLFFSASVRISRHLLFFSTNATQNLYSSRHLSPNVHCRLFRLKVKESPNHFWSPEIGKQYFITSWVSLWMSNCCWCN